MTEKTASKRKSPAAVFAAEKLGLFVIGNHVHFQVGDDLVAIRALPPRLSVGNLFVAPTRVLVEHWERAECRRAAGLRADDIEGFR